MHRNPTEELKALCDVHELGERAACAFELPAGGAPDWIEVMPAGRIAPRDSRAPWINDRPEAVIAASLASGVELPFDYEHQTEYAPQNGQPAPAAGWIKALEVRDGAVWARVEWNERARAMLQAREYRYISPVFLHEKATRRVSRIMSVALTNTPAFSLKAIARQQEVSGMDPILKAVLDALGLGEDADQDAVGKALARLTAAATALASVAKAAGLDDKTAPADLAKAVCTAIKAKGGDELKAVAKAAGLGEDASADDVAKAVAGMAAGGQPDPTKYVPRAEFDELKTSLATLQQSDAEEKATAAVDDAIADGKVAPASRDWALAYARKDAAGFADFVKSAPVVIKPGSVSQVKPPKNGAADRPLDENERAVCRAMGLTEEAFKKSRADIERAANEETA